MTTMIFRSELRRWTRLILLGLAVSATATSHATIVIYQSQGTNSTAQVYGLFTNNVPSNSATDAGTYGTFTTVLGSVFSSALLTNANNGPLQNGADVLNESVVGDNNPNQNQIRFRMDLGTDQRIAQINSYSRYDQGQSSGGGARTHQRFTLYVAPDGVANPNDPTTAGWVNLGSVDTEANGWFGGTEGVSFQDTSGVIGMYRYVLWDTQGGWSGNYNLGTFYGEFDVVTIPEPSALALLVGGGLLLRRVASRHERRKSVP